MKRASKFALAAAAAIPLAVPAAMLSGAATASTEHSHTTTFWATLRPVPHNRVHGSGSAAVRLDGRMAQITVRVDHLLNDAPHAMHIHAMGEGECPEAQDAGIHNGHRAMSTTDGLEDYGPINTSLTTRGDTSPASGLALARFPHRGTYVYHRTIRLSAATAQAVRALDAVVVVHGIDYNHNGRYDGVLGPSDLDPALPLEGTAPAICGPLHP